MPSSGVGRDGHQGWSRRSEAAHERIFGEGQTPPPADFTLADFTLADRIGKPFERPIMREKIPHCPYDGYPCHCAGACRR